MSKQTNPSEQPTFFTPPCPKCGSKKALSLRFNEAGVIVLMCYCQESACKHQWVKTHRSASESAALQKPQATDKRLMAAVTGLMGIVEGCLGERWASNGRRLVDTPEWCELYCAWSAENKALKENGQP